MYRLYNLNCCSVRKKNREWRKNSLIIYNLKGSTQLIYSMSRLTRKSVKNIVNIDPIRELDSSPSKMIALSYNMFDQMIVPPAPHQKIMS